MKFSKTSLNLLLSIWLGLNALNLHALPLTMDTLPKISGIAAQSGAPPRLHAATQQGLFLSRDDGKSWSLSYPSKLPITMLSVTADNTAYTFVLGKGLLRMLKSDSSWRTVSNKFGAQILTQLSAAPNNSGVLYGLNQFGKMIVSSDYGKTWGKLPTKSSLISKTAARGKALYTSKCQSCHGIDGVGETYTLESLQTENYLTAIPLDESSHAWHHTDDALVKTILEGSPRGRMQAWKKQGLTEPDARDLVAYIKSLWSKRILDCQGPKHMQCM